jgi:hypothetical protein
MTGSTSGRAFGVIAISAGASVVPLTPSVDA